MRLVLVHHLLFVSCSLLLPPRPSNAFQPCINQRAPVILNGALQFCSDYRYGNASCCDVAVDATLQMQFENMGFQLEGVECAGLVKSILCAVCNPFSAELFSIGSTVRAVPVLCKASAGGSSAQSEDPKEDYCKQIWKYCKNTPIWNSPFQSSVQESSPSVLTDLWQSEEEFCASFSGTSDDQSVCFNGHGVSFNTRQPSTDSTLQSSKMPDGVSLNTTQPAFNTTQPSTQQSSKLPAILGAIFSIATACAVAGTAWARGCCGGSKNNCCSNCC